MPQIYPLYGTNALLSGSPGWKRHACIRMVARELADEARGLNKPEATVANTTVIPVEMGMLIPGCRITAAAMCAMWQIPADNATAVMP
jgi:hypothetical protein